MNSLTLEKDNVYVMEKIPCELGSATFAYGRHSITVELEHHGKWAYLRLNDEGHQCCGSDISMACAELDGKCLTIHASIKANTCEVDYLVLR